MVCGRPRQQIAQPRRREAIPRRRARRRRELDDLIYISEHPSFPSLYVQEGISIGFGDDPSDHAPKGRMKIERPACAWTEDICTIHDIPRDKIILYKLKKERCGGWSEGFLPSPFKKSDHERRIFEEYDKWYEQRKNKGEAENEIEEMTKLHEIQATRDSEAQIEDIELPQCERIIVLNKEDDLPAPKISTEATKLTGENLIVTLKVDQKKRRRNKLKFPKMMPCEVEIRAVSMLTGKTGKNFTNLELSAQDLTANFKPDGTPVSENLRFEFERKAFENDLREVEEITHVECMVRFRFVTVDIKDTEDSLHTDWVAATMAYEKLSKRLSSHHMHEEHCKKRKSSHSSENEQVPDSRTNLNTIPRESLLIREVNVESSNSIANEQELDSNANKNSGESTPREQNVVSMPTCHLSGSKYEQPVRASDGFVYERESIEKWLEDHDNSPFTTEQLEDKSLVPVVWNQETGEWKDLLTEKQGKHPSPKVPKGSARKVFKKAQVFSWLAFDCDDLQEYMDVIVENGYDSLSRCRKLNEGKLKTMGITKQGHLDSILEKVKDIPPENDVQAQMSSVDDTPICPITNMPYKKPVLGSDDQIYDERFIEAWKEYYKISQISPISPYTNEQMDMQKEFVSLKWMEESKIWQEVETIE